MLRLKSQVTKSGCPGAVVLSVRRASDRKHGVFLSQVLFGHRVLYMLAERVFHMARLPFQENAKLKFAPVPFLFM